MYTYENRIENIRIVSRVNLGHQGTVRVQSISSVGSLSRVQHMPGLRVAVLSRYGDE